MKKRVITITAATLFLLSALTACNKKETTSANHTQTKTITTTVTLYNPENAANPYDIAGQMHNDALAQFNADPANKVLFSNDWMDYTGNFLAANGYSKEDFEAIMTNGEGNAVLGAFNPYTNHELTPELLDNWSEAGAISSELKDFYTAINSYIDDLGKTGDYNAFKESMVHLETSVVNFTDDNDKAIALSAASIARHTFAYWLNNNGSSGIAMPMSWGKADFCGAVGGAVRASVVGFFGGPVGWGAWAGSVLGGAIANSIASVL